MGPNDVAARGNFCTVDENGVITDRRAGRIPTEEGQRLCNLLKEKINLPGVELFLEPEKEYRFVFVLRGEGLDGHVSDTDPQAVGKKAHVPEALKPDAEKTAELVREFVRQGNEILKMNILPIVLFCVVLQACQNGQSSTMCGGLIRLPLPCIPCIVVWRRWWA